jgi:hypothetical protein
LLRQPDSRYSRLVESEDKLWQEIWDRAEWRKLRLENGVLLEPDQLDSGLPRPNQLEREVPTL